MADLVQVANVIVDEIVSIVYPNGTSSPSVIGKDIRVFQGWPDPQNLSSDLQNDKVNISVFPHGNYKLLPYNYDWFDLSLTATTITLTVSGNQVTVGGTISTPQNVAIIIDGVGHAYAIQSGDTLNSIAATLATRGGGTSSGAVATFSSMKHSLIARVSSTGIRAREIRRQEQNFQISIWANCFDVRDPLAAILDPALTALTRLTLPDGTIGIIRYQNTIQNDDLQKEGIFRRDLFYSVEYPTIETSTDYAIILGETHNANTGQNLYY